ncbi:MAG TPA: TRAP transporter large permease subunit [Gammaproteobacteria bacterium]|nr:TRAP transporter large permease subunit [Gammaproteobacteria bacterium]
MSTAATVETSEALRPRAASPARPPSVFDRLIVLMNGAGVIWIFALTFLICADITGRTVFDHPIKGVTEMVSLSLVASVFLQLAFAVSRNRLTQAEMLIGPLAARAPGVAARWEIAVFATGIALFVLLAVGEWPAFLHAFRTSEFEGVEGIYKIPVSPIKGILVFGSVVVAVEYARRLAAALPTARDRASRGRGGALGWLTMLVPLAIVAVVVGAWFFGAEPRTVGGLMVLCVLALIALGMPIAISLMLTGFLGLALLKHDFGIATKSLALAAEGTVSDYVFATVPLFVLMGLFVDVSDVGRDAFRAAQRVFGRVYGGLGVATVAANAIFAAITGISIASAAIFTKIAVPEMVREGYSPKFAVGITAGSSVLGMLIPPSLLLIIYGVIAEVSIGALFRAAVVPGLILAAALALGVIVIARFSPRFAGNIKRAGGETAQAGPKAGAAGMADADGTASAASGTTTAASGTASLGDTARPAGTVSVFLGLLPVVALIVLVLGGIYGGVFTPTEAGAAGAFAAMLIALVKRRLDLPKLWEVICETGQVTVIILFLIISASTFSRMLTLTELPQDMAAYLGGTGLGMLGFLAVYLVLLLVLGCVLDSTSILLILLPLALPVVTALGGNLVWFGVVTVIGVEIGLLTPPFGLSVYVIKSSLNDERLSLGAIFAGSFPFVIIITLVTIVLMAIPRLSLLM